MQCSGQYAVAPEGKANHYFELEAAQRKVPFSLKRPPAYFAQWLSLPEPGEKFHTCRTVDFLARLMQSAARDNFSAMEPTMKYRRLPIEAEAPEQLGYERVRFNLAESS